MLPGDQSPRDPLCLEGAQAGLSRKTLHTAECVLGVGTHRASRAARGLEAIRA